MLDREFTFSDPTIIAELQKKFVVVAGNTHELQNGHSAARDWFMEMAERVNPRVKSGATSQGFYVVGADGTGYGFNNNRSPERVLSFIQEGESKFAKNPPSTVAISDAVINAPFAHAPLPSTSVLRVFSRIRPLPPGCDVLNTGIGRDHLWVYPDEIKEICQASKGWSPLPRNLSYRLARYHLVDNVRGEPDMWALSQVKSCSFEVRSGKAIGGHLTFELKGAYEMSTADGAHGLKGTMEGEFTVDPETERILLFRAYGEADVWGRGTYTPNPPPGHFRIVFAVVNVSDDVSKVTPPQAAAYGDGEYRKAAG